MDSKQTCAPVVLRLGVCLVYLWFGLNQLINPAIWTSYLPGYTSLVPISPEHLVLLNGATETLLAVLLLIGWRVRIVASLLALHAFHIMLTVGYSAIGVRDFGIFVAVFSVALYGRDSWCKRNRLHPHQITV